MCTVPVELCLPILHCPGSAYGLTLTLSSSTSVGALTLPSPFNVIVHSNTNKNVRSRSVRECHLVINKYLGSERGRHENHQIRHFSGFIKRLFNINWECGNISSLLKHFKIKNWLSSYKCTSAHTTYHLLVRYR